MKLVDEFKAFAMKGNVVDMAVGIIIGVAFGKIISSIVSGHHYASDWTAGRRCEFYRSESYSLKLQLRQILQ